MSDRGSRKPSYLWNDDGKYTARNANDYVEPGPQFFEPPRLVCCFSDGTKVSSALRSSGEFGLVDDQVNT